MARRRLDAVVITEEPMFQANAGVLVALAMHKRLPSAEFKEFAEAGGLFGYGAPTTSPAAASICPGVGRETSGHPRVGVR